MVSNEGRGGADRDDQDPRFKGDFTSKYGALREYCREAYKFKGFRDTWINGSIELACHTLLEEHLEAKFYKKVLKQVCFVDDNGDLLSFPKRVKPSLTIYNTIREQRDDLKNVTFLNELSFDDAVSKIKSVEVSDG
tara:strand:+ start:452 stop:859 length:408 start_codon:yes stop_codon:yes gene_type:complete